MENAQRFPPVEWLWNEYSANAAWYSGDVERLRKCAQNGCGRFWASDEQIKLHVPIAADISALSASMIFSDSPVYTCEHKRTQERIEEIADRTEMYGALLQAAELASAFGGVFWKWSWDKADGAPILSIVPADAGMPEWQRGKVHRIKFWTKVREDRDGTGAVWRLEETYESNGHVLARLLKGDESNLGKTVPLSSIPETRGMKGDSNSGTNMLLAGYVPNLLPNRKYPHMRYGRSDYEALYGLFDALDEVYSSIQRETRMTKTTVVVPMEYLRRKDDIRHTFDSDCRKSEWVFDNGKGVFVGLDIDTGENASPVTIINPEIRAEQRISMCDDIVRRILSLAGYAPQSAGLDISGSAESGTALTVRERKTLRTTESKKTHWWHALKDIIRTMLALDSAVFRSGVDPDAVVNIELPSNTQPDIAQMAEILEQLERAGAVSVETKVALLHPDWDEQTRDEEVQRIRNAQGAAAQENMERILSATDDGGDE